MVLLLAVIHLYLQLHQSPTSYTSTMQAMDESAIPILVVMSVSDRQYVLVLPCDTPHIRLCSAWNNLHSEYSFASA
jgi:hypothetical protein